MTTDLQIATERVYKVFAQYPLRANIEGCPCCVSDADKARLHSKPLRELSEDELKRYASKALTTWGDIADFKHFLPRIFELLAQNALGVDESSVLDKLDYGNWVHWPKNEVQPIREFLMNWWAYLVTTDHYLDHTILLSLGKLIGSFQPLLDTWEAYLEGVGFGHLINFINDHAESLIRRKWPFEEIAEPLMHELESWLISQMNRVEQAFYQYEKQDSAWAERIAAAYDKLAAIKNVVE